MSDRQRKPSFHEKEKPLPPKKNNRVFLIRVIILVLAAGSAWFWYISLYGYISVDDAYIDRDKATISSKMLGRIVKINAKEGDYVKKGSLLVELDPTDFNAQLNQDNANLNDVIQRATLAKSNLDRKQDDYSRSEPQYKNQTISEEQFSHTKNDLEAAQIMYKNSLNQIEVVKSRMEITRINLNNTKINTPFNGVISKKWISEGDVVQPAQPIFSINNTEDFWAVANVEETNLKHINISDEALISVDAYKDKSFKGVVFDIGSSTVSQFSLIPADNASGNFTKVTQRIPIKIQIKELKGFDMNNLRPGLSIIVKFKKKGK
jgi:membrane fusion protein, multidrug efflux system